MPLRAGTMLYFTSGVLVPSTGPGTEQVFNESSVNGWINEWTCKRVKACREREACNSILPAVKMALNMAEVLPKSSRSALTARMQSEPALMGLSLSVRCVSACCSSAEIISNQVSWRAEAGKKHLEIFGCLVIKRAKCWMENFDVPFSPKLVNRGPRRRSGNEVDLPGQGIQARLCESTH